MSRLTLALSLCLPLALTACFDADKEQDDDEDEEFSGGGGNDWGGGGADHTDGSDGSDGSDGGGSGGDGSDGGGSGGSDGGGSDTSDDDGDGFTAAEEAAAGTNPDNYYSRPYTGDYNTGDCEPTPTGRSGSTYANGDVPDNFTFVDQYGEEVDLYSFCGVSVMLVVGAEWCGPCNELASQVQPFQDSINDYGYNHQVIEILIQDVAGRAADQADAERWASSHGLTSVPALAAGSWGAEWERDNAIPTVILIDDTMTIRSFDEGNTDPSPYW